MKARYRAPAAPDPSAIRVSPDRRSAKLTEADGVNNRRLGNAFP